MCRTGGACLITCCFVVLQMKGVAPRTRRHVHVEGADSDDWMVVDLGECSEM